ncbi:MAG: reverse transcriptase family protein [Tsuneonella suprasediminis]
MITASPNRYRQQGKAVGIDTAIVERALSQAEIPERNGVPAILTLNHLAHRTGIKYEYLRDIARRATDPYRQFTITKRNNGRRLISTPEPLLLALQRWIASEILNKQRCHPASFAYEPGSSPAKCAAKHLGARWLIKLDVHDFFENISERAVYRVFREVGYQPLPSLELARLCTRRIGNDMVYGERWRISAEERARYDIKSYRAWRLGCLPQGAPTSPMLANLASRGMDDALDRLARRYGLLYTRYSDDMSFSTAGAFERASVGRLVTDVARLLRSFDHTLHAKKTKVSPPHARKVVLGLQVDGTELRLLRDYRKRMENHVRCIDKHGLQKHREERNFASTWGMIRHVDGLISYAEAIEGKDAHAETRSRFAEALVRQGWPSRPAKAESVFP